MWSEFIKKLSEYNDPPSIGLSVTSDNEACYAWIMKPIGVSISIPRGFIEHPSIFPIDGSDGSHDYVVFQDPIYLRVGKDHIGITFKDTNVVVDSYLAYDTKRGLRFWRNKSDINETPITVTDRDKNGGVTIKWFMHIIKSITETHKLDKD